MKFKLGNVDLICKDLLESVYKYDVMRRMRYTVYVHKINLLFVKVFSSNELSEKNK